MFWKYRYHDIILFTIMILSLYKTANKKPVTDQAHTTWLIINIIY